MTRQEMIDLVDRYFSGVDAMDFDTIAGTMTDDCIFSVETHGTRLRGLAEIRSMFHRLWDSHAAVLHENFTHVAAPESSRIAVQFSVVNTHHDGKKSHKSNCNFFELRDGRFSSVAVYMAGENTLNAV